MSVQHFVFVLKEEVKLPRVTRQVYCQDSLVGNCQFWFGDYFCTGCPLPSPLRLQGSFCGIARAKTRTDYGRILSS